MRERLRFEIVIDSDYCTRVQWAGLTRGYVVYDTDGWLAISQTWYPHAATFNSFRRVRDAELWVKAEWKRKRRKQ